MSITVDELTDNNIKIKFVYTGYRKVMYSNDYKIEIKNGYKWYTIPYIIEPLFNDVGYSLSSDLACYWETDYKSIYGELATGQYRIIKSVLVKNSSGHYDKYYVKAEFQITK